MLSVLADTTWEKKTLQEQREAKEEMENISVTAKE